MSEEVLITPCCDTKIEPGPGFQGIDCCGDHYTPEELRE